MELEKISKARDIKCWISNDDKWTYKRYRENRNEAKPGERWVSRKAENSEKIKKIYFVRRLCSIRDVGRR